MLYKKVGVKVILSKLGGKRYFRSMVETAAFLDVSYHAVRYALQKSKKLKGWTIQEVL